MAEETIKAKLKDLNVNKYVVPYVPTALSSDAIGLQDGLGLSKPDQVTILISQDGTLRVSDSVSHDGNKATIQVRRDTAANFAEEDPVLKAGEWAYVTDLQKVKIGDGETHFTELDYLQTDLIITGGNDITATKSGNTVTITSDVDITNGSGITVSKQGSTYTVSADIDKAYFTAEKIKNHLYYVDLNPDQQDLDYATQYFEENYHNSSSNTNDIAGGACSSIRNGNFYGRNYDWYYDNSNTIVLHNQAGNGKYESIGVAYTILTEEEINEGWTEYWKILPYQILDGINEYGLFVNNNVVPTGDKGRTTGTHSDILGEPYYCMTMLPKIILDRFTNATDAVAWLRDYAKVYAPVNEVLDTELHFMIGDAEKTYIVEYIQNECVVTEVTGNKQIMTNFYISNTTYDSSGHIDFSSVTNYGAGLERFNILVDHYSDIHSLSDMRNAMESIKYTKAYTEIFDSEGNVKSDTWKTEWAHDYSESTVLPVPMDLHANSPLSDYITSGIFDIVYALYENRSRDESPAKTWQTVHSSVYDLTKKYFTLRVQEELTDEYFTFPIKGGYVAGENIIIDSNNVISAVSTDTLWEEGTGTGAITTKSNASQGGQAIGNYSVAEGFGSDAKGNYSHVEGQLTTANGGCAHAEGQGTTAQGNCSHAEGIDTIAQNQSEHAEGQYNKSTKTSATWGNAGNTLHSIGIGTGAGSLEEQDRRNAFEVMQNGDAYMINVGGYEGDNYSTASTLQEVINNKQDTLTAGNNITISSNVISANVPSNVWTQDNLVAGTNISIVKHVDPNIITEDTLAVWHLENDSNYISGADGESHASASPSGIEFTNTQAKFGTYSAYGTGTAYVNGTFKLSFNDSFTFDFWFYRESSTKTGFSLGFVNTRDGSEYGLKFHRAYEGAFDLLVHDSNGERKSTIDTADIPAGVWNHIAVTYDASGASGVAKLYVNGVFKTSFSNVVKSSRLFSLIALSAYSGYYTDEFRLQKGVVWDGNFTPPTQPYAVSSTGSTYQINASINCRAPVLLRFKYKDATVDHTTIATGLDLSNAQLIKVYKNGLLLEENEEDSGESGLELNDYSIDYTTNSIVFNTAIEENTKVAVEVY